MSAIERKLMRYEVSHPKRKLAIACALLLGFAGSAQANLDNAVNHYLRGFDACNEANGLIRSGQINEAKQRMQIYLRHLAEAERMDPSIKTTQDRGMPGNIQFCERVQNNIEVEEATPHMNEAIAACDQARDALDANDPQRAESSLALFKQKKDQALRLAPKMLDIFAVASQVRRCERLENRVARSSQQAEQQQASIDNAREESDAYVRVCEQAIKNLSETAIDDAVLRAANQAVASAESHKQNAMGETVAQQVFKDNPGTEAAQFVSGNISKGDACIARAKTLVTAKTRELAGIKREFDQMSARVKSLQDLCDGAKRATTGQATDARYETARTQVQRAQEQEREIRNQLRTNQAYSTYSNWPQIAQINEALGTASTCVAEANTGLGQMFTAVQQERTRLAQQEAARQTRERDEAARLARERADAARLEQQRAEQERIARERAETERLEQLSRAEREKAEAERTIRLRAEADARAVAEAAAAAAAAAAEAAATQAREQAAAELARRTEVIRSGVGLTSVSRIEVNVQFDGLPPPYAVLYVHDDTAPPANVDISISRTGFDRDRYFVGPETTLQISNADNSLHRLPVVDDYHRMNETLARLYPRQRQRVKVSWPVDRIVELRSERGALSVSQIITIASNNYRVFESLVGSNNLTGDYVVPSRNVTKATLLLPKTDPLEIDFSLASSVSMPIIQNGQPVGTVSFIAR